MRLPVAPVLASRDGTANKDGRLTNMLVDSSETELRPGLALSQTLSGVGNGLTNFEGDLVATYGSSLKRLTSSTFPQPIFMASMPTSATWYVLAWNGTVFLAVSYGTNQAATSTDGITWVPRTLPSVANWYRGAWNGTTFCIVAYNSSKAATSTDGIAWAAQTLTASSNWYDITAMGSRFCAVSASGVSSTSTDGIAWVAGTLPMSGADMAVACNSTTFVALRSTVSSFTYATSTNGSTWTTRTHTIAAPWQRLAWNGTVFCAVANTGTVTAVSTDGLTWSSGTITARPWSAVVAAGSLFFATESAVAVSSRYSYSTDGVTWTLAQLNTAFTEFWNSAVYGSGNISVVSASPHASAYVFTLDTALTTLGTVSGSNFDFAQSPL